MRGAPGPDGGEDGGQAGAEIRVAHPGGRVVDRGVRPGVLVAVTAPSSAGSPVPPASESRRQPAGEPHRGVERRACGGRRRRADASATRVQACSTSASAAPRDLRAVRIVRRPGGPVRSAGRRPGRASRRVSPRAAGPSLGQAAACTAASSSSARASKRLAVGVLLAGSPSMSRTTADGLAAQERSAGPAGTLPPSRGSSRISASRASCRDARSAPSRSAASSARHQAERHGVACLAGPQQVTQRLRRPRRRGSPPSRAPRR